MAEFGDAARRPSSWPSARGPRDTARPDSGPLDRSEATVVWRNPPFANYPD
jgi:hypothetical protein